jgi:hypothetical protein
MSAASFTVARPCAAHNEWDGPQATADPLLTIASPRKHWLGSRLQPHPNDDEFGKPIPEAVVRGLVRPVVLLLESAASAS